MIQVFVVRSDDGTCVHESWKTASVYLRAQIDKHGIATVWTKLMSERAFDQLKPFRPVDAP